MPDEQLTTSRYDQVDFPDGRTGFVPSGYGQAARALMQKLGGAGEIGTFADGFQAAQSAISSSDMENDVEEAKDLLIQLDLERDAYAAQLDSQSLPPGARTKSLGERWKSIQRLQDRRDYLQERIISTQIRINYGGSLAAAGRAAGRVLGSSGTGGGDGLSGQTLTLGAVALGLGVLLLRDRDRTPRGPTQY